MLDEQYFGDKNIHPYLLKNFINLRVDIDKKYGRSLFNKYKLKNTPAVLIANKDGTEWGRTIDSAFPVEEFHSKLDDILIGKNNVVNLKNSLKLDPNNIDILINLAKKHDENRMWEEVVNIAKSLIAHPDKTKTFVKRVEFINFETDYEMSAFEYGKYLLTFLDPEHTKGYAIEFPESPLLNIVFSYFNRYYGRDDTTEKAFEVFDDLIKRFPDDKWLVVRYIDYCVRKKINLDRCLELAEYAYDNIGEDIYIGNSSNFDSNYAWLLINKGMDDKLKELSKRYIEDFPDRRTFLQSVANAYHSVNKHDLAFSYLEESIRVYANDKDNLYALGRMAALSGKNLKRGIECLTEFITTISLEQKAWLPAAHWRRGLIYEHQKFPDKEKMEYEKALKLNPKFRQAKTALDNLKK